MGANPTPLAVNGVFQALSTHLIDGAENNWPTFESARHLEIAKFWSETQHSYSPEILTMSKQRFEAMSPADREIVLDAAARSVPGDARELGDVLRGEPHEGDGGRASWPTMRTARRSAQRCGSGEERDSRPGAGLALQRVRDLTG